MTAVAGVLLAGGQARRMGGGDKCLRALGGKTLLARTIERVQPQVKALVLNANGDPARFAEYGLPVVPDVVEGFAGPLAGILTGLEWVRKNAPNCPWMLSAPTDAPFLPDDLVQTMKDAVDELFADMACAMSNGRSHPVVGLWPVRLAGELRKALVEEDIRKIDVWSARYRLATVEFPADPVDPFFNANRPEDLAEAERLLAEAAG
jgi:molybdopterin-guanine dinucleotide biosynthesis protein A